LLLAEACELLSTLAGSSCSVVPESFVGGERLLFAFDASAGFQTVTVALAGQTLSWTIWPAIRLRSSSGRALAVSPGTNSLGAPIWVTETNLIVDHIPAEAVRIQGDKTGFPILANAGALNALGSCD